MQHIQPIRHQRGLTFFGLVLILALVAVVGIAVARAVPSIVEYQSILKAVERAKTGATVAEIERAFDASAAIDDIHTISGKDLEVTKVNDQVKIKFAFDKEVPLAGPVSLLIHYSGESK